MKKLLILLILASTLFASSASDKIKAQILEKILSEISINEKIKVWSDDLKVTKAFKDSAKFEVTQTCNKANIIILRYKQNLDAKCSNKNIFVLKYNLLSELPQSFGSFFWKKGRPNIVLIKPRIEKQNVHISSKLKPYLEDKVW